MNLTADFVELFGNRKCNCTANAAAYNANLFKTVCMCGNTERAYKIVNIIAFVKVIELFCCCTDNLENNTNCAGLSVITCNRKRNTLTVLVNTENDELSRLCLLAISGASISISVTVGFRDFFLTILYIFLFSFRN